jgi:hypothetical protein
MQPVNSLQPAPVCTPCPGLKRCAHNNDESHEEEPKPYPPGKPAPAPVEEPGRPAPVDDPKRRTPQRTQHQQALLSIIRT